MIILRMHLLCSLSIKSKLKNRRTKLELLALLFYVNWVVPPSTALRRLYANVLPKGEFCKEKMRNIKTSLRPHKGKIRPGRACRGSIARTLMYMLYICVYMRLFRFLWSFVCYAGVEASVCVCSMCVCNCNFKGGWMKTAKIFLFFFFLCTKELHQPRRGWPRDSSTLKTSWASAVDEEKLLDHFWVMKGRAKPFYFSIFLPLLLILFSSRPPPAGKNTWL